MIRSILLLNLFASAVVAQDVTTDAFGILPTVRLGDRGNWAGLRETSNGGVILQEAGQLDAAILLVGPKSIVAGPESGHAVAIGLDVYGNMVSGVKTQFVLGYGDNFDVMTRDGIANLLFTPPPRAGSFLAGADVGGVQSARADYRVTANLATVQPRFAAGEARVLPETFGRVSTEPLVDAYGNIVEDGVGVNVILVDEAGTTMFLPSVTRDGSARSILLARDLSGGVSGELTLAGTSADGLTFSVDDMELGDGGRFLIWGEPAINAVHLRVGPLETTIGYLVPDGTAGSIDVDSADGSHQEAKGWVLDGYMSFVLPLSPDTGPFDVTLVISGNLVQRRVDLSLPPVNLIIRGAE